MFGLGGFGSFMKEPSSCKRCTFSGSFTFSGLMASTAGSGGNGGGGNISLVCENAAAENNSILLSITVFTCFIIKIFLCDARKK
jgi:hypothetical protein